MRLIHFSDNIIKKVWSNEQMSDPMMNFMGKPQGLWVSDEDAEMSWLRWCKAEEFRESNLKYAHSVKLRDDANILMISNLEEFDRFDEEYSFNNYMGTIRMKSIEWFMVAKKYDGIIISPYQWDRRLYMSSKWYYGWDCASGCIWNKRAIKEIKLIIAGE